LLAKSKGTKEIKSKPFSTNLGNASANSSLLVGELFNLVVKTPFSKS